MNRTWTGCVLTAVALVPAIDAAATVVVNYDGNTFDYVTTADNELYQRAQVGSPPTVGDFDGDSAADDSITGITFSDTSPLNPTAPDYNTALSSAIFYGGLERIRRNNTTDGNNFDRAYVNHNGNVLTNRLRVATSDAARDYGIAGVLAWSVGPANIDLTQDATITAQIAIAGIDKVHLVAKQGSQWYIGPQIALTGLNYDADVNSFFKAVDFTSVINEDLGSGFSQQNLNDVSMIGVYFEDDQVAFGANVYLSQFLLTQFTVDAALVPEPASLALLAAGGFLILWPRRHA